VRFFFYGTLIDPEIRRLVLGRLAPRLVEPATLSGWRCVPVPARTYPMIVPDRRGRLSGILVRGLSAAARRRLERYEDDLYAVAPVEVGLVDRKRTLSALAFVARPGRTACGAKTWDFAEWQRRHKRRFMQRLRRRLAA